MQKTTEMKPTILAPRSNGLTALQLLQLPKKQRAKILTVKQHDYVLVETGIWKSCKEGYAAWAREMEAHTSPGKRLGSAIRYTDSNSKQLWVFEVPTGPLREAKDSILLANSDDCEVEVKKNRITVHVAEGKLSIIENFPAKDGWYQTDPTFGIPVNVPLSDSDSNARYLYRIDKRVGPLVRGYIDGYDYGRDVDADSQPSGRFGVLTLTDSHEVAATAKNAEIVLKEKMQLAEGMAKDARVQVEAIKKVVKLETDKIEELIELLDQQ